MASAAVEHDARRGAGGTPGGAAPRPRRAAVRGGAFAAQERRGSTSKLTKILAAVAAGEAVATATVWRVNAVPMALKLLMAHTTWVTATVAAATCSGPRSVAWMGKRPDGSFSWWSYPLFAQWHILVPRYYLFKREVRRRRHQEPVFTKVAEGWYIGGWPSSADATPGGKNPAPPLEGTQDEAGRQRQATAKPGGTGLGRRRNAGSSDSSEGGALAEPLLEQEEEHTGPPRPALLDCTAELPRRMWDCPAYLCLPVYDCGAPTVAQLDEAVEWAAEQRAAGREVLVHCANGHGRSATVLAACMLAQGLVQSPEEAESVMQRVRPLVKINSTQGASLSAWWSERERGAGESS